MELLVFFCVFLPILTSPLAVTLSVRSARARDGFTAGVCVVTLALAVWTVVSRAKLSLPGFCGMGANLAAGGFRSVLLLLSATVFPLSALAARRYFAGEAHVGRYQAFFLVTFGALNGVFLSQDLFTTYVFFEMMSLSSWVWVAQNETDESKRAADTYLAIAVIGGLLMLYGVFELYDAFGTLSYDALSALGGTAAAGGPRVLAAGLCLLAGFGAKAGMYPLHIWLPKAHPVAPAPASALLSGILTKGGVYGVLLMAVGLYRGNASFVTVVLVLGTVTMLYGAVTALCTNNLKRVLACSSLSQIGFILVATAVLGLNGETPLAAGGALLHMVNHALIKLDLFVCAGALYTARHTLDLNALKGAGRKSPLLFVCFLTGALSIAGVPGFSGYVSKTLIHEAIVENSALHPLLPAVEWLFLLSGGLTLAYMAKLVSKLFFEKGDDPSVSPVRLDAGTALAVTVPSVCLLLCGLFPQRTFTRITAYAAESLGTSLVAAAYYSLSNLSGAAISLGIGALVYLLLVRPLMTRRNGAYIAYPSPVSLEKNVYRPALSALAFVGAFFARLAYSATDGAVLLMKKAVFFAARPRQKPGTDDHFAHYSRKYVRPGRIGQTLAFELMLFGVGVTVTLLYLLLA